MHSEDEGQLPGKKAMQSEDRGQLPGKEVVPEKCPENYNIPSMNNNNVIPLTAWRGSPELGLPGFITGHPITVRALASDGKIMTDMTTAEKFGEGAYAEIILDTFSYIASPVVPSEFVVGCAYPNPFNSTLTIPFSLLSGGDVTFTVVNLLGQRILDYHNHYNAGNHRFIFDTIVANQDLSDGIYFLQVQFKGRIITRKAVLMK